MGIPGYDVKIYADGADLPSMIALSKEPYIDGFTTNPTLMRQSGVVDYLAFAETLVAAIPDKPISFEVIADNSYEIEVQARRLQALGPHVYVKVPITDTFGHSLTDTIRALSLSGVQVNVTAVTTSDQSNRAAYALRGGAPSIISVFAGRIADTGIDPVPCIMRALVDSRGATEVLWASPREVLNIVQAAQCRCHIITLTPAMIMKAVQTLGKDLADYSRETVQMFYRDALAAGLTL